MNFGGIEVRWCSIAKRVLRTFSKYVKSVQVENTRNAITRYITLAHFRPDLKKHVKNKKSKLINLKILNQ
jgi:hypothetical protein